MSEVQRLLEIMVRLRDPDGGCPWDLEQSFESIAPYTLEEAYEVDHAIQLGDMAALREELGDLLLQIVFHAQLAREAGHFDFDDVVEGICQKLIRRHPHVFGDARVDSAEEQTAAWEVFKAEERAASETPKSLLDGIPPALPALARAVKLLRRADRAGLDDAPSERSGTTARQALDVLDPKEGSLPAADMDGAEPPAQLGRLLFACARLAGGLRVDPEQALRVANRAYEDRVRRREAERGLYG